MQVAAKAALMRQTLSPDITSDAKTPGQVTFNVTPKGKDKDASSTHQNAQAGSSNTETIKPITVDPPTPRTIIPRVSTVYYLCSCHRFCYGRYYGHQEISFRALCFFNYLN